MLKTTVTVATLFLASLGLFGCDVKKTQEGNITVPKYEVTAPNVSVTTTEKTVSVPTVKTEEKTIAVPSLTITPAKDK